MIVCNHLLVSICAICFNMRQTTKMNWGLKIVVFIVKARQRNRRIVELSLQLRRDPYQFIFITYADSDVTVILCSYMALPVYDFVHAYKHLYDHKIYARLSNINFVNN